MSPETKTPSQQKEHPTLNRIRVETAISRFPVHRLVKKGIIAIDLKSAADNLQTDFHWKVSHNSEFGQPGPLAYKIDTLIVNRRIDEAPRPLPEAIRLGSLREICRDAGLTDHNTDMVKLALHQNASAYITAKLTYKAKNGREKRAEIGYTRYSVIFTGESLPNGTTADAVYIVINPSYRDMLNHVEVRPLDYDYLLELAPGPQRLYELLSFQVYGAIASGRPRAKMLYSEYCRYAPQTRYPDFDHVKKQMYKVHQPHRESRYIVKVDYQQCIDLEGHTDWEMLYTPGPKALAEFHAFTTRRSRQQNTESTCVEVFEPKQKYPVQANLPLEEGEDPLVAELCRRGVTHKKARELVSGIKEGQEPLDQLEYIDSVISQAPQGKFHNPPGLYITVIQQNSLVPDSFISTRKRLLWEQTQQQQSVNLARKAKAELDYTDYQNTEIRRYINDVMPADEYRSLFDQFRTQNRRTFKQMTSAQLDQLTHQSVAVEIRRSGRVSLLSFEEFELQSPVVKSSENATKFPGSGLILK